MQKINFVQIFITNRKKIINLLLTVVSLILIDQTSKIIAQKYFENAKDIILIPDILSIHFLRNEITHAHQYIIYFVISLVVFPLFILYAFGKSFSKIILAGFTLLWSAVISNNIVDVFLLGYIRDFINLHGVAVGNIADQYRNAGLLLVIVGIIKKDDKKLSRKTIIKLTVALILSLIITMLFWRYLAKYLAI